MPRGGRMSRWAGEWRPGLLLEKCNYNPKLLDEYEYDITQQLQQKQQNPQIHRQQQLQMSTNSLYEALAQSSSDVRQNEFEVAYQRLSQLSPQYPQNFDILLNKSVISILCNELGEGIALLRKAVDKEPYDFRGYYGLFVGYWRKGDYGLASAMFGRALSVLYGLLAMQRGEGDRIANLDRSLQLWDGNTASYVLKTIYLIEHSRLQEANQVTKQALQKCIQKHHIFALCCILDSRLNRQASRQQNAKDYHTHLLRSPALTEHQHAHQQTNKEEATRRVGLLVEEFNDVVGRCGLGRYSRQEGQVENVVYMVVEAATGVDVGLEISRVLGAQDLACIKQDREDQQAGDQQTNKPQQYQQLQTKPIIFKDIFPKKQSQVPSGEDAQVQKGQIDEKADKEERQKFGYESQSLQGNMFKEEGNQETIVKANGNFINQIQNVKRYNIEENGIEGPKVASQDSSPRKQSAQRPKVEQSVNKNEESPVKQAPLTSPIKDPSPPKESPSKPLDPQQQLLYPITHPNFQIRLIQADLQISQERVGKMDPYVYYEYGNQKHKSTIAKKKGAQLRWENQVCLFSLERNISQMRVSIYNREIFRWDDLVGEANFTVKQTGYYTLPVELKGKKSGEVVFHLTKKA